LPSKEQGAPNSLIIWTGPPCCIVLLFRRSLEIWDSWNRFCVSNYKRYNIFDLLALRFVLKRHKGFNVLARLQKLRGSERVFKDWRAIDPNDML
jgi:hypothetical protein